MDINLRSFEESDRALLAYAVAFNIDITSQGSEALYRYLNDRQGFLSNDVVLSMKKLFDKLKSSTTIDDEDIKVVTEWVHALLTFRVKIATTKLSGSVSFENKTDPLYLYRNIFGFGSLPAEFEVALLNGKAGDTSKVNYYKGLFDGLLESNKGGGDE